MKLSQLALTLALTAVAFATHAAAPSRELVEDVAQLSGLDEQLAEVQRFAVGEADNRKDALNESDYTQLRDRLTAAFDQKTMHKNMIDAFTERGDAEKLQRWRDELRSPLMTRMRALEKSAMSNEAYQQTIEFGRTLESSPPPKERLDLVTRLAQATAAIDLALDSHLAVTRALLRQINPTLPENKRLDAKKESAVLQDMRIQLAQQLNDVAMITYLYTYRDVSDADLRDYIGRYESELGKWATELTARSVRKALQAAADIKTN